MSKLILETEQKQYFNFTGEIFKFCFLFYHSVYILENIFGYVSRGLSMPSA